MVKYLSLFTLFAFLAVLNGMAIEDDLAKDPINVAVSTKKDEIAREDDSMAVIDPMIADDPAKEDDSVIDPMIADESTKEDDPNKVDKPTTQDDLTATEEDPTAKYDPTTYFNFVKQAMTWDDANKYCKSWGGRLVTVESAIENAYIHQEQQRRHMGKLWIGYNDKHKEGKFTWLYANSCNQWTNWRHGEPNGGRRENCVEMWDDGYWNDLPCIELALKRTFVCHKVQHCWVARKYLLIEEVQAVNNTTRKR